MRRHDLDALVEARKARKRWLDAERQARRMGYAAGLSPVSIRAYQRYVDAFSDLIHSGLAFDRSRLSCKDY